MYMFVYVYICVCVLHDTPRGCYARVGLFGLMTMSGTPFDDPTLFSAYATPIN